MSTRLLLVFSFILACSVSTGVVAKGGAGGVLYTSIQGTTYVLLADHRKGKRGWASFGGRLDGQLPIIAAAREIEEETNGLIKQAWASKMLPDATFYKEKRKSSFYTTYFLEIPFKPAIQFTSTEVPKNKEGYGERGPYTWVPLHVLESAVFEYQKTKSKVQVPSEYLPPSKKTSWFWKKFLRNLSRAQKDGVWPWPKE